MGDTHWLAGANATVPVPTTKVRGGIGSDEEEAELRALNDWMAELEQPRGTLAHELTDPASGAPLAVLDLAWPQGVQEELSEPVAVLLDESAETISTASAAGFRCFTDASAFRRYVETEVLAEGAA